MPVLALLPLAAALAAPPPAPALDFEFFKAKVQPIFTTKRPDHARCVSCHTTRSGMRLQPLPAGRATWTDAESRINFEMVRARVTPGNPATSKFLMHPLAEAAGGEPSHDGGKHWLSQDDPEFQVLAAWVRGATLNQAVAPTPTHVRIIQTNSAGDDIHVIDPTTNRVVGHITGIEVNHGVAAAPDGSRLYVSNEAESTLDVVDGRTLKVTSHIPLSGHPNNVAIGRDGRHVYVAIAEDAGAVDVVDTLALQRTKSLPVKGAVHNTYVTPDGKWVVAGSIAGQTLTVFDAQTDQLAWSMEFDLGVRPMAFERNADGSTKRIFVQLSELNGFAVVDFVTHKEIRRVELPKLAPGRKPFEGGGNASHGMAVTADGRTLVVNSRLNGAVYLYALPDLKLLGAVDVGNAPDWVTLTPDSKSAYVANAQSNSVSVIDLAAMKEVTRIPVGQVPKRNLTAMLP